MASSLPTLLFSECQRYCVNKEFAPATSQEETTCLANCQAKTYRAFDLFMGVRERFEARKNFRAYVDISRYTGMEIEHKHDTESVINHKSDGHIHPASVAEFTKVVDREFADVQKKALN